MKTAVVGIQLALCGLFFLVVSDGAPTGRNRGDRASGSGSAPLIDPELEEIKRKAAKATRRHKHSIRDNPDERFTLTALGALFNVRDTNQDLKITKADLMDPRHEGGWTEAESKAYMSLFGQDENGAIEFSQYLRTMSTDPKVNRQAITLGESGTDAADAAVLWEKEMKVLYKMCDINGDNLISPNDVQEFLAEQGLRWRPQDKLLFALADIDEDGQLNFEGFKEFLFMQDRNDICKCSLPQYCGRPHKPPKPIPSATLEEIDD